MQTTIRTTVTLPTNVYELLRERSFLERKTVGTLIAEKFQKPEKKPTQPQKKLHELTTLFNRVCESGRAYDAAKAVREERDR